ncbi:MAG TPA: alpha/beta hydrolase [Vicinamibacterales bacterium]|nr:alpha/beta hydrolase [Vicinamibacterales bacterium]
MNILRLAAGLVFLAVASLTALPAPTHLLWTVSLAATEWGYWIAVLALLPLFPTPGMTRVGQFGGLLSAGAIALFLLPVVQAKQLNEHLPSEFQARFGSERRERSREAEYPRDEPLYLFELVSGPDVPAIRFEERVFASPEGHPLTLDVYRPAYEHGPLPGVIVVHGGTWQDGDNGDFLALNAYLASRDFVVASIHYRLAPRWKFPAPRDDVFAAIAHLKVHGHEIGLDPSRLAILGRGAGGQLALLAAYTSGEPAIKGAISLYGPTDLRFGYDNPAPASLVDSRGLIETYLGGPPSTAAEAYASASPINFVGSATPPTLLIHGMRDDVVRPDESARLEQKLKESGVRHLFVRLKWATHACDRSIGGPCGQVTTYAIERFLDAVMMAPKAPSPAPKRPVQRASAHRTTAASR